jgi:GT2 family glycosyltransferase
MNKAIIILSYNHQEQTQQCLRSFTDYLNLSRHLPEQTEKNWPLILIHNGSRPEIVAKLKLDWQGVDHLVLPENTGYTGGMNAGLNYAFSKYDVVVATTNDTLVRQLPTSLPAGIGVPVMYRRTTAIIDSCGGTLNLWNGRLRHLRSPKEFYAR